MTLDDHISEIVRLGHKLRFVALKELSSYSEYTRHLHREDLSTLVALFERITASAGTLAVIEWLNNQGINEDKEEVAQVWYFLLLCEILGDESVPPFASGVLHRFPSPSKPRDWTMLPRRLRYLAQPAERYGGIQFPEQIERFSRFASRIDMATLRAIAAKASADKLLLTRWVLSHSLVEHSEARLVYFLTMLFRELDLC